MPPPYGGGGINTLRTYLLTYCNAQLTRTVNSVFSILALALAYALAYKTCSYSYSSLSGIIALRNIRSQG